MIKLLVILLSVLSLTAFAQQKRVAVYVTGEDEGIKKILGSKLVAAIARSEEYIAIERTAAFLSELNKEHNYQRTGAVDDNDISRIGKQFGVQYVCVADVTDVFGEKYISARLIDVETAEIVDAYDGGGRITSMSDCVRIANEIAGKLSPEVNSFTPLQDDRTPTKPQTISTSSSNSEIYDFGKIKEENGRVSHTFILPIRYEEISDIKASCECLSSRGEIDPISPDNTRIMVTYNPHERPGGFTKTTTIFMKNGDTRKVVVKGYVIPKQ